MKHESPLYGLVVCGGKSSRMGTDKSMLEYHGRPQRYHVFELLSSVCDQVYISCNAEQVLNIPPEYNPLPDDPAFGYIGPMAALLTAFQKHPEARFMAVGCDYPLLEKGDLLRHKDYSDQANTTVFYTASDRGTQEPLLAVYHPSIFIEIIKAFNLCEYSLRRLLTPERSLGITAEQPERLKSVDTPEDYQYALKLLATLREKTD